MSEVKNIEYVKKSVGRPKLPEDQKKPKKPKVIKYSKNPVGRPKKGFSEQVFDKKAYMKEYMKDYNKKNSNGQHNRRNTTYYIKKFNIDKDFVETYGIFTANMYKCREDLKKIKTDCPMFLEDMKDFIKDLQVQVEEPNHVADLEGVEVLTEIE
tara:strand:- start:1130 stop:1591 length:462 start_codon:yes stop_codon:yes gene_type:complete